MNPLSNALAITYQKVNLFSTMLFIDICTYDLNVWIGYSFCTM